LGCECVAIYPHDSYARGQSMIGRMYRACLLTPIVLCGSIPSVPATDNSIRLGNLLISVESLSTVDTAPRPFSTGTAARKTTEGYRLVQATVSVTNLGKHLVCTRLKSTLDAVRDYI